MIDFSTGYFRQTAEQNGHTWTAPDPPQFLWGKVPKGALYHAKRGATEFAWRFILEKQGVPAPIAYAAAQL